MHYFLLVQVQLRDSDRNFESKEISEIITEAHVKPLLRHWTETAMMHPVNSTRISRTSWSTSWKRDNTVYIQLKFRLSKHRHVMLKMLEKCPPIFLNDAKCDVTCRRACWQQWWCYKNLLQEVASVALPLIIDLSSINYVSLQKCSHFYSSKFLINKDF